MELNTFWNTCPKAAIAFSGGVDSAYLLYAARQAGAQIKAYYVKSAFQPQFELDDAKAIAEQLGVEMKVLQLNILSNTAVQINPADRCYHCKKTIFQAIGDAAKADGFGIILDGTNASDDAADRPGMRALTELSVRSPLRECNLTKVDIRRLSKEAGLFTHDKPAYACLATRIPTGEPITVEKLRRTERAENYLADLGFRDFRVRSLGDTARLQVTAADLPRVIDLRENIIEKLKQEYTNVLLDLEVRK